MKKIIFIILTALTLLTFSACSNGISNKDLKTAEIINSSNTDTDIIDGVNYGFEFDFLAKASEVDCTGYEISPGFGCDVYYNSKYTDSEIYVKYTVSGAPDCLDEWYVTGIYCTDPEVKFFGGLTLADDSKIKEFLKNNGFKIETFDSIPTHYTAKKGRIFVKYSKDLMIYIGYESTNNSNVIF